MPGRLRYAGRGLIVEVATSALVSPREVVDAYNELLAERERRAAAAEARQPDHPENPEAK